MENKKKLNILILSWRGPNHPNAGGAEQSTFAHAKGWVKAGHNVFIFTAYFMGAKAEEKIEGVQIIRRGTQFFGVQIEAFKWYLFGTHDKFDLVVDEFHGIPFFTPLYIRTRKMGFIHEVAKEVWGLNPWPWPYKLLPSIIGTIFEPLIFKFFYKKIPFMTVSDSTKTDLISWGIPSKSITVVHNGVNFSNTKLPMKEKDPTIIFLGAVSRDKGIEDALKVFSILNETKKNWKFWVVGKAESTLLVRLKAFAERTNIGRKITFFGFVADEEKFKLLARAHLMINTSAREGWGLVVIEGASVGIPTVGYNVPGLKDSILDGKTGILCNPNPQSCAQQILTLLDNPSKYKNFQTQCKNWSRRFDWETSARNSLKLINSIMTATE